VATHVELYRALEPHVGKDAAQMNADAVPPAAKIATKHDVFALKEDIQSLKAEIFKWGLAAVLPIWIAVWGTLVAQLLQNR
jgi:hypothetical protein